MDVAAERVLRAAGRHADVLLRHLLPVLRGGRCGHGGEARLLHVLLHHPDSLPDLAVLAGLRPPGKSAPSRAACRGAAACVSLCLPASVPTLSRHSAPSLLQALVAQYNIEDGFSGVAPALFCLGCHCCMLIQELNFVKHATITGMQPGQATGSTIVIGQQAMTY